MKQTHYSVQEWVDWARGLGAARVRKSMQAHLKHCSDCREFAEDLRVIAAATSPDREAPVPLALAAAARALLSTPAPASRDWLQTLREVAARLVFDSGALAPLPAGLRSRRGTASVPRLLTYEAGKYEVDVQMEPARGQREKTDIVGQIVRRGKTENRGVNGAVVQLVARGLTVAETETNGFGEFLLSHSCRPAGVLRIAIRQDKSRIDLALECGSGRRK